MSEIVWESRRVELLRIIARKDEKQILTEDASFPRAESTRQPIENLQRIEINLSKAKGTARRNPISPEGFPTEK